MDGSSSTLGGNSTSNQNLVAPQNSLQSGGSQTNLTPAQSNVQQPTTSLLNGSGDGVNITDSNGNPLDISSVTTKAVITKTTPTKHHNPAVFGISFVIIAAVFLVTWLSSRQTSK